MRSIPAAPGDDLENLPEKLTCRVVRGASYTLSDGNQGFDGSGHIAQEWADSRVFVTSAVAGDSFNRALAEPPVKPPPLSNYVSVSVPRITEKKNQEERV